MTDLIHPKWREFWQVDNPEWVAIRKKEWLLTKKSPVLKNKFKKHELEKIKTFFMTGSAYPYDLAPEEWEWNRYHPDTAPLPVSCSVLFQCWFAPNIDVERWSIIKQQNTSSDGSYDRYTGARSYFRLCLKEKYPISGTLFNGRDAELYRFFTPTRLLKEDHSSIPDELFYSLGSDTFFKLYDLVDNYLKEVYNADSIASLVLPEWCDTLVPAFLNCEDESQEYAINLRVVKVFNSALDRIASAEDLESDQIRFAKDMVVLLQAIKFPESMEVITRNLEKLSKALDELK